MKPIRWLLLFALLLSACTPRTPEPTPSSTLTASPTLAPVATATPTTTATASPTATPPATASSVDADALARHRRIFEQVWNTLNTQYVYPDFNGVDWAAGYDEFKARIDAGLSDEDFWRAMAEMLERLQDDHSHFLSPEEAREQDAQLKGNLTYTGIGIEAGVQADKDQAVIYAVFPNSPAEEAGLRAHDAIFSIDGEPAVNPDGTSNLDRLRGPIGTTIELRVKSPGEPARAVTVTRRRVDGSQRVDGRLMPNAAGRRIGYLLIPSLWESTIEPSTRQALTELMAGGPLDGLILDMRTNGGGLGSNLLALLGFFTAGERGSFVSRDDTRPLAVTADPIGNSQDVPLIILIDKGTESYAEVLSGALREAGRARLVGQTTVGNVETIYGYDFEDGSRAWIARETFVPLSGDDWEKTGLVPDVLVDADWDEFTQENDLALTQAVNLLAP